MTLRAPVKPELLEWACHRAGADVNAFAKRFPKLDEWVKGSGAPTLKQLEAFARATRTPIGFLFLPAPPQERLSIPDFRTIANKAVARPSPDLIDTLHLCEQRQEWYREFAQMNGEARLTFVGAATTSSPVLATAAQIRERLGFSLESQRAMSTWTDTLRHLIDCVDRAGVLIMCSGVVRNDTSRVLDPSEFRGFAISDPYAPLVFINGSDSKSAQMFTIAHEVAHIWLGESALSDAKASHLPLEQTERWCNRVAAEFLVPLAAIQADYRAASPLGEEVARLARVFKVSTLVILRRIHDIGGLSGAELATAYSEEEGRLKALAKKTPGGEFYLTQAARVGKRFARALVASTLEGQTLRRDAMRMLGFAKQETFEKLGVSLGVTAPTAEVN